jgi:hypothetical protein
VRLGWKKMFRTAQAGFFSNGEGRPEGYVQHSPKTSQQLKER